MVDRETSTYRLRSSGPVRHRNGIHNQPDLHLASNFSLYGDGHIRSYEQLRTGLANQANALESESRKVTVHTRSDISNGCHLPSIVLSVDGHQTDAVGRSSCDN